MMWADVGSPCPSFGDVGGKKGNPTPFLGVRQDRVVLVLWFGDYFRNFRGS